MAMDNTNQPEQENIRVKSMYCQKIHNLKHPLINKSKKQKLIRSLSAENFLSWP